MNKKTLLVMAAMTLMVTACTKPYDVDPNANMGNAAVGGGDSYGSYGAGYAQPSSGYGNFYDDPTYGVNVVGGPEASEKDRVIYFSYDSSRVDQRSENVIREHANYLRAHPQTMVVLEGHTDERGTREYNIGLGERRAYSVKSVFEGAGVNTDQMRVLSYGEERPAVWGSDENSYARNRRVVIIY